MKYRLLITDLDNTLYDWVTFFSTAFTAMVEELARLLSVPEAQLLAEFQAVHRKYGTSEPPFAALELPSVLRAYPGYSPNELATAIDPAFHRFNSERTRTLQLYPGVAETLTRLGALGIDVVGHTEASSENAYFRLRKLDIDRFFRKLYVLESRIPPHPSLERTNRIAPPIGYIESVPHAERKPNPRLLLDICQREGFSPSETLYVGDSITRDISMAHDAGVVSAWARYGTRYERRLWDALVSVSHWTPDDVERESRLRDAAKSVKATYTLDSFPSILPIVEDGAA